MFGKKVPNKKPPPQIYEEEYSEEQSQPLIEEVDADYEPTEKEVREYAIQTLGMKLPQDQNLLYLAREGLKAPITTNWVPYQSRNGQIYYKHNITQQKTYDHPTDTEYRKKYEQIKEKAARKNLKSISMKQNLGMQGLLPSSSITSGFGIANNSGMGLSNASGLSAGDDIIEPTIDSELLSELEQDYSEYQKKQEKQWREWQAEVEEQHQKKMKKIKQQYEEERNRLASKGTSKNDTKILQQQKAKIQQNLEETEESTLNHELRLLEKQEEGKLSEYKAVYEEDNTIKLRKLEEDLNQNYEEKTKLLEDKLKKLAERRQKQRQNRVRILKQTKEDLQKPNNPEILKLLHSQLEDNLASIKLQYAKKLKQKQAQLDSQLSEMKRLLGVDKSKNLMILASKKEKLLALSNLKISAKKNKQIQVIETDTQKQFENEKDRLKDRMTLECDTNIQNKKRQLEEKIQKAKAHLQIQFSNKCTKEIEEMYQKTVAQKNNYESSMNKKMSQLRMRYINKISDNSKNKQKEDIAISRVVLQEKESQIINKQEMIKNLQKQLELERQQWKQILFDQQLCTVMAQGGKDGAVTSFLKQKMRQMNITYQSPELVRYLETYNCLQTKYAEDKKFLAKILIGIQDTTAYNFAEMRKNNLEGDGTNMGSGALVKKYNEDVRKMRQNQDMLNKFQVLVKKTELGGSGYEQNLEGLRTFIDKQMKYNDIALKNEFKKSNLGKQDWKQQNVGRQKYSDLQRFEIPEKHPQAEKQSRSWISNNSGNTNNSMEQALRQHSQFLSNVKNQLNRKLYQVRYEFRH